MKSKYNPLIFSSLATGVALFATAPLDAADVDTTGGVTLSAENRYTGAGTLTANSGGDLWLGGSGGAPNTEFAMTGGLIDIVSGTTVKNGGWQKGVWTDNKATLQVNGALDIFDGNNIFADALTGSGTVGISSGISWVTLNKSITLGVNGGGGTFTGTVFDSDDDIVSLIKEGSGTQILTGSNTYRGATTINGGTLKLQGAAFSTTARAYSIASGAVLNLDGSTGVASGNTTISGTGTLRISGGALSSGADGSDLTLALGSGALIEIQSGASMVNGGWQNMTWAGNLADMQVDGMFDLNDGNAVIIDALTGSGTVTTTNYTDSFSNSRTLTVGQDGGSGTFSGTITQATVHVTGLIKTGGGTQTLTGTNSYTGNTTVNGGTLIVNGNITSSSLTTVQSGGTLGGSGAVGSLTVDSGGFLNPGNSPGILSVDGDYIQLGTVNIEITGITAGSQHDQVNVDRASGDGAVTLSGSLVAAFSGGTYVNGDLLFILLNDASDAINGTFSGLAQDAIVTNYGGFDWKISYTADSTGNTFTGGNDIALMAVPEPSATLLGGLGIFALMRRRR
jgi:autotransporter-associated beta strand protein